jgi:hypothetical protein
MILRRLPTSAAHTCELPPVQYRRREDGRPGWGVAGERLFYRMVGFVNFCRKYSVCGKVVAGDYAEHIE